MQKSVCLAVIKISTLSWVVVFIVTYMLAPTCGLSRSGGKYRTAPGLGALVCWPQVYAAENGLAQGTASLLILLNRCVISLTASGVAGLVCWSQMRPAEKYSGCCPSCGYYVGDLTRCPECGRESEG